MGKLNRLENRVRRLEPRRAEIKRADPFYNSPEWREARHLAIAMHQYRCARCGCRPTRLFVDHIKELRDGGAPLDQANLEPLCGSCHQKKTMEKARQRLDGSGEIF
jgi:5-methylcytosine-specific restriction protein A